jgi:hypothetical protein
MKSFLNNKDYFKRFAPAIIICLAYIICLSISFKKWIFFPWDVGREMLVPYRLLQGDVLYRDIFYHYGPLAPYLVSWLWKFTPVSLNTFYFLGTTISIFCIWLVYRLSLKISGYPFATLIALFFINFYIFRPTRGNLIFPYSLAYSLSTFLTLSVLMLAVRYLEKKENFILFLLSFLIGIMMVTKIEYALASFATVLFIISIKNIRSGNLSLFLSEFISFSFLTSIVPMLTILIFSLNGTTPSLIIKSILPTEVFNYKGGILKESAYNAFNCQSITTEIFYLLVIIIFVLNLASTLENIFKKPNNVDSKFKIFFNIIIFFAIVVFIKQYQHYSDMLSAIVIISFPGLIFFLMNVKKLTQSRYIYLGIILFNSFLLYFRDKPSLSYSYAASILSFLLLAWVLLDAVSAILHRFLAQKAIFFYKKINYFLFYAVLIASFLIFKNIFSEMNFSLKTDRGSFFTLPCYGEVYSKVISWLKNNTAKEDTLMALPEGGWLNFILDRKYPYRYTQWMPFFIPYLKKEIKQFPPDVIVLLWPWGYRYSISGMDFSSPAFANYLTKYYDKVFECKEYGYIYLGLSKVRLDNYVIVYRKKK